MKVICSRSRQSKRLVENMYLCMTVNVLTASPSLLCYTFSELGQMIFQGPFQPGLFYEPMIKWMICSISCRSQLQEKEKLSFQIAIIEKLGREVGTPSTDVTCGSHSWKEPFFRSYWLLLEREGSPESFNKAFGVRLINKIHINTSA